MGIPRASGDEPTTLAMNIADHVYSPRQRG